MKSQIVFEDFIVGFLMTFMLVSTVFLFINSNAGTDIDFFNTSIYQEDQIALDFLYLGMYESESAEPTPANFIFNPATKYLAVNVSRTGMPSGEYDDRLMDFPVKMSVIWLNCTIDECFDQSDDFLIKNIIKYDTVFFNYTFNSSMTAYSDCSSNITVRASVLLDFFDEGFLENNEYIYPVDFCFYYPEYIKLESLCPVNDKYSCTTSASPLFFKLNVKTVNFPTGYNLDFSLSNRTGHFFPITFDNCNYVEGESLVGGIQVPYYNIGATASKNLVFTVNSGKIGGANIASSLTASNNCKLRVTILPSDAQNPAFRNYLTIEKNIGWCKKDG